MPSDRRSDRWSIWVVGVAAAVLLSPLVLVPFNTHFGEGTSFFGYPYAIVKHLVLAHQWPFWDPYTGCGDPLLGNPLAGQFYPPAWLIFAAPTPLAALRWSVYLHLVAAAVGSYVLARWLGCRLMAAVLAPIGLLFNPYMFTMIVNGLPGVLYAVPWLVWGAAFLWRGTTGHHPWYLLGAGGCLAAQVLGGTTYEMHFTALFYLMMIAYVGITTNTGGLARGRRMLVQGLVVFGSAYGLAGIKLLPVLEYAPISTRSAFSLYEVEHLGQNPSWRDIIDFFTQFFGAASTPEMRWLNGMYVGLVGVTLWVLLRPSRWRRPTGFFGAILVLTCWAALGPQARPDLFAGLYHILPNFRYSPYTGRILSLARLALPILAALGASAVLAYASTRSSWVRRFATRGLWVAIVGYVGLIAMPFAGAIARHPYGRLDPPQVGTLMTLASTPALCLAGSRPFIRIEGTVALKNAGDARGPDHVDAAWLLDQQFLRTVNVPAAGPGETTQVPVSLMIPPNRSVVPQVLSLRLGPSAVAVATLTPSRDHSWTMMPALVTTEAVTSGRAVFGRLPDDWNAFFGALTRWQAPATFRVYSESVPAVYPYLAFLHGYQTITYSNHGMMPKYQLFVRYGDPNNLAEQARLFTMFRILNTRYVLMPKSAVHVDRRQTRLVRSTHDAELYELTSALPSVWVPRHVVLLIGGDADRDFGSLESKLLVYDPNFDPVAWAVFASPHSAIETVTLKELQRFDAVAVTTPRVRDPQAFEALLEAYQRQGGRLLRLHYTEVHYTDPHRISNSMLSDEHPAKRLTPEATDQVGTLLRSVPSPAAPATPAKVAIEHTDPMHWRFQVDSRAEQTPLVVSETFFPGWECTVDGRPAPIFMADGIVRGVMVIGPGIHVVALRYRPASFRWGCLLSSVSFLGCLGILRLWRPA